jgi:hypothetical protein
MQKLFSSAKGGRKGGVEVSKVLLQAEECIKRSRVEAVSVLVEAKESI